MEHDDESHECNKTMRRKFSTTSSKSPREILQHNNSIKQRCQNEERALPYKEDWTIKVKRQKYLIKGGKRVIHVKYRSTNEKIGKELNGIPLRNMCI